MDFQRYYDGVGLIVENKINNSLSTCPLCGEMKVDWEIVFDFKGDLICVLAKCPHCGGVIKTIFNFNNGEMPSSFTVSDTGETNRNDLVQGVNYTLPSANRGAKSQNVSATQSQQTDSEGSTVGWGHPRLFYTYRGLHSLVDLEGRASGKSEKRRHRLPCVHMFGSCRRNIVRRSRLCDFGYRRRRICVNAPVACDVDIRQICSVCCVCKINNVLHKTNVYIAKIER